MKLNFIITICILCMSLARYTEPEYIDISGDIFISLKYINQYHAVIKSTELPLSDYNWEYHTQATALIDGVLYDIIQHTIFETKDRIDIEIAIKKNKDLFYEN